MTKLHGAARVGNLERVKELLLLEKNDETNDNQLASLLEAKNRAYGNTPLHQACVGGHAHVVQYLIEQAGANANARNRRGQTPLHIASSGGNVAVVQVLLDTNHHPQQGVSVDAQDSSGMTPLHLAASNAHQEVVEYLVEHGGANVNVTDGNGESPLALTVFWRIDHDMVQYFVNHGANVNLQAHRFGSHGKTALLQAVQTGGDANLRTVRILVEQGNADVTIADSNGNMALHYASKSGGLALVGYLMEQQEQHTTTAAGTTRNVNLNVTNHNGQTPLHWAAAVGNHEVMLYFILSLLGANDGEKVVINARDNRGNTPLHLATDGGHLRTVKLLANRTNVNLDAANHPEQQTALHLACRDCNLELVQCLVAARNGSHLNHYVNAPDRHGSTALHYAIESSRSKQVLAIVQCLVQDGRAHGNARRNDGATPLHLAVMRSHFKVVSYLVQHGAEPDALDANGNTPLILAASDPLGADLDMIFYLAQQTLPRFCTASSRGH